MKVTALDIHKKIVRLTAMRDACLVLLRLNDADRRFDHETMLAVANAAACMEGAIEQAEDELREAWKV